MQRSNKNDLWKGQRAALEVKDSLRVVLYGLNGGVYVIGKMSHIYIPLGENILRRFIYLFISCIDKSIDQLIFDYYMLYR